MPDAERASEADPAVGPPGSANVDEESVGTAGDAEPVDEPGVTGELVGSGDPAGSDDSVASVDSVGSAVLLGADIPIVVGGGDQLAGSHGLERTEFPAPEPDEAAKDPGAAPSTANSGLAEGLLPTADPGVADSPPSSADPGVGATGPARDTNRGVAAGAPPLATEPAVAVGGPPAAPGPLELAAAPESLVEARLRAAVEALPRPPGPRRARFDSAEIAEERVPDAELVPRGTKHAAAGVTATANWPKPDHTRTMVVANQKGGVGKTTTSVNLAAALALGGLSVLVVDLDPQGNASTALGVEHPPGTPGTYEVLIGGDAISEHVVDSPEAPNLRLLPATIDLAAAEIELVTTVARENRLLRALRSYLAGHEVDYVLLDCPPSLGLLTLNALVAANEILIPIQCEYYALEGVSQLIRTINLVKGELNDGLELSTVLLTMYDGRTKLASQVAAEVRAHFPHQTLPTVIPRSVRISEAPSYGQTVLTYHPDSAGAVSYLEAAREIARRGAKETR